MCRLTSFYTSRFGSCITTVQSCTLVEFRFCRLNVEEEKELLSIANCFSEGGLSGSTTLDKEWLGDPTVHIIHDIDDVREKRRKKKKD